MARGILSAGAYLPRARLDRSAIGSFVGSGGGRGTRAVASYDEDTTTMGVEAARAALRSAPEGVGPDSLWFSTVAPAYLDKTNATAIKVFFLGCVIVAGVFGAATAKPTILLVQALPAALALLAVLFTRRV